MRNCGKGRRPKIRATRLQPILVDADRSLQNRMIANLVILETSSHVRTHRRARGSRKRRLSRRP